MTTVNKKPLSQICTILCCCFFGGLLAALGVACANRFSGLPLITTSSSIVSTDQVSLFSADGEARITVVPDQAEITLGITITDSDVKTAQDQANAVSNQLQSDLLALGIADSKIKTQDYSVYPEYDWSGDVRRVTGYTVSSSLRVTVEDFSLLNSIIDTATADGVNEIGQIRFTLSEGQLAQVKKQARQEAIEQAKANATELASLTGLHLGNIVNVYEYAANDRLYSTNMMRATAYEEDAYDYGTSISAGETTYTYNVTLSYQTLN